MKKYKIKYLQMNRDMKDFVVIHGRTQKEAEQKFMLWHKNKIRISIEEYK